MSIDRRCTVSSPSALPQLDAKCAIYAAPGRYVPLTTASMRKAADLWADARNRGIPTGDIHSIDGDVILAAQVLTLSLISTDVIVASDNVRHLSRYVAADAWEKIVP